MEKHIAPSMKILRHPSEITWARSRGTLYPLNVEFDLSNACNLACSWCAFGDRHNADVMLLKLARSILRQLKECDAKAITLSGGGEPTTNPQFAEIVECAHDLGFDIGMYTNGVDISRVRPVLDRFEWIQVSLDEVSHSSYRVSKGRGAWDQVVENVGVLVCEKPKHVIVGLGFLIHPDNVLEAGRMIELGELTGADYVQFKPVVGLPSYEWTYDGLEYLKRLQVNSGAGVVLDPQRFIDLRNESEGCWERGYEVCRGCELVPAITADGKMWVCPNTRMQLPLGDLSTEFLLDVLGRRQLQPVVNECRVACRNHYLNTVLEYVCGKGRHDNFV